MRDERTLVRLIWRLAGAVVVVALAAALTYAIRTLQLRPLDGVEGEVLFEADRIRAGFPLYVDPLVGAHEYGPVPARYFVLYPPVWAWIVSWIPPRSALVVARFAACTAWFGLLGMIAARAPRPNRRAAWAAAAFAGGVYMLALYGSAARPDAIAVAFAGAALVRSVERGRVDPVAAALFAVGAWTKPNVLGLGAGAIATQVLVDWRAGARAIFSVLGASLAMAIILSRASDGAWITHLLRATGQPASLPLWLEQVPSRAQFLGAPLVVALAMAYRARARDASVKIALGALAASLVWTITSLAKIGSATNYWMEPVVGAVVIVARVGLVVPERGALGLACAAGALLQSLWTGVATVRSSLEAMDIARVHAAFVARARAACNAGDDEIVLADEPGVERMINGRIVTTPFQMTHLARRGLYPLGPWIDDVELPEVRCIVMEDDLLDRFPSDVNVDHDRFGPELREVLRARFVRVEEEGGWRLYRVRPN